MAGSLSLPRRRFKVFPSNTFSVLQRDPRVSERFRCARESSLAHLHAMTRIVSRMEYVSFPQTPQQPSSPAVEAIGEPRFSRQLLLAVGILPALSHPRGVLLFPHTPDHRCLLALCRASAYRRFSHEDRLRALLLSRASDVRIASHIFFLTPCRRKPANQLLEPPTSPEACADVHA